MHFTTGFQEFLQILNTLERTFTGIYRTFSNNHRSPFLLTIYHLFLISVPYYAKKKLGKGKKNLIVDGLENLIFVNKILSNA